MKTSIHCYYIPNPDGLSEVPFMEYMSGWYKQPNDSEKQLKEKREFIEKIRASLAYLVGRKGNYHSPPHVKQYRGHDFGVLKVKVGKKLLRILFYTDKMSTDDILIVLLNVFEKPELYEKSKKLKVDREIEENLQQADEYLRNYLAMKSSIPLMLEKLELAI